MPEQIRDKSIREEFGLEDETPWSQGREFTTTLQAPDEETLEAMIQGMQDYAQTHHMEQVEILEQRLDPDGGFRAIIIAHNWNAPTWRGAGKVVGKIAKTAAKGAYDTTAGFAEGLGIEKPTARSVGRATGRTVRAAGSVARGATEAVGHPGIEFQDADYFFGGLVTQYPVDYTGTGEGTRTPTSRLPKETLMIMVTNLASYSPEIYNTIWHEGITHSEFVGSLRNKYPEIYDNLREEAHTQLQAQLQATSYTDLSAPYRTH